MSDTKEVPTSFRFSEEANDALDEGAKLFGMTRTKWIEWLAISAVSGEKRFKASDNHEITVISKVR